MRLGFYLVKVWVRLELTWLVISPNVGWFCGGFEFDKEKRDGCWFWSQQFYWVRVWLRVKGQNRRARRDRAAMPFSRLFALVLIGLIRHSWSLVNLRPKYPQNPKNDQNTLKIQKMTKIPSKPKNDQNAPKTQKMTQYPRNLKHDQNTPKTQKWPK